jgi:hypothetical protein
VKQEGTASNILERTLKREIEEEIACTEYKWLMLFWLKNSIQLSDSLKLKKETGLILP